MLRLKRKIYREKEVHLQNWKCVDTSKLSKEKLEVSSVQNNFKTVNIYNNSGVDHYEIEERNTKASKKIVNEHDKEGKKNVSFVWW